MEIITIFVIVIGVCFLAALIVPAFKKEWRETMSGLD